jgi:hypothetical protein
LFELAGNLGYEFVNSIFSFKANDYFKEKQKEAWEKVRESIDAGTPCYGWELEQPEYYVITGYDDTGYYYNGPGIEGEKGPKPWQELGETDIGIIEVYGLKPGKPPDYEKTVKESLQFALKHARDPGEWVHPGYHTGLEGYDVWITTVEKGEATGPGMSYNAAVWAECRVLGLKFLDEAKARLDSSVTPLLEDAIQSYFPVVDSLSRVVELFPIMPPNDGIEETERYKMVLEQLKKAREAEEKALESLERIVWALRMLKDNK